MVVVPRQMSHNPQRTCIGCRKIVDQTALIRLSLSEESTAGTPSVVEDLHRKAQGRGAWLHPAKKCLTTALKTRAFNRAFRTAVITTDFEEQFQATIDAVEFVQDRDESGSKI